MSAVTHNVSTAHKFSLGAPMLATYDGKHDVIRAAGEVTAFKWNAKAETKARAYSIDVPATSSKLVACKACMKQSGKALNEGLCVKCDSKLPKATTYA